MLQTNRMRKLIIIISLIILATLLYRWFFRRPQSCNVLVFSKTAEFRHESIEEGKLAIMKLGKENGFEVDTTEDAAIFKERNLRNYKVIIFLSTTGDVLNESQQLELTRFIQAGGSFVGIHAAVDTEYDWPWYNQLVGAYFESHPQIQKATVKVVNPQHPATERLPTEWERVDEWYNLKDIQPYINVLINLEESSYEGGKNGENHPISWFHEFDGGRVFYSGFGHTSETFQEPEFLNHLLGGIQYAAGDGSPVNYDNVTVTPDARRFAKTVMESGLNEPMELEVLKDGRVLYIERRGGIRMFFPQENKAKTIGRLEVFSEQEDGLLGLAKSPDFESTGWIYLFYSPAIDDHVQYVSRFTIIDDTVDLSSEKIILKIPNQRDECCHSGGGLEFDSKGNLYITVGDNTNPFASDGYAPIDEREGRSAWDAQKSSANSMDLRGKILRIKPEADGTYSIPDGNLFPKDDINSRPEIYIMGNRNPFRLSVDNKTGFIYWGEVGPDAAKDSTDRGPKGYDEVNQARSAGFFGWPYFVADNKAYNDYDFTKNLSGRKFDARNPINNSPNNSGLGKLPSAQPAFIYYPYDASEEFPLTGTGGRNAMAGQVYYFEDYKNFANAFPEYYDGKLFIYDWMRGWINVVTMDDPGNYTKMEGFLPEEKWIHPIDMVFSEKGELYIIEYGSIWYVGNADARLSKISFISGNRAPVASITTDKIAGAVPLEVLVSARNSVDYDGDDLTYHWKLDGKLVPGISGDENLTISENGIHEVELTVTDSEGNVSKNSLDIYAGNTPPEIALEIAQNETFFRGGDLKYSINLTDEEDSQNNKIDLSRLVIAGTFLPSGFELKNTLSFQDYLNNNPAYLGKILIENSDCQACHQERQSSVGPSYLEISNRYENNELNSKSLSGKIVNGSVGVWGTRPMIAHHQLNETETKLMVEYILNLDKPVKQSETQLSGIFELKEQSEKGIYVISASYTDQGANGIQPLTTRDYMILRNPVLEAEDFDFSNQIMTYSAKAGEVPILDRDITVTVGYSGKYFGYSEIDFTGITSIDADIGLAAIYTSGGVIEVRLDSPAGDLLGMYKLNQGVMEMSEKVYTIPIQPLSGFHNVYFLFKSIDGSTSQPVAVVNWVRFNE